MKKPPLLLVGAGGHARACIDVVEQEGRFVVSGLVGLPPEVGSRILGYPVVGTDADLPALRDETPNALVVVGQIKSPEPRIRLFGRLEEAGFMQPVIISPRAYVSPHAMLGAGTIVMPGAVVNAGAVVGRNCILNSQSLVEHDVTVDDHCHIAPAVVLSGGVRVGRGTFIGSGSVVRQGIKIGAGCLVGMGQRLGTDCADGTRMPSLKETP